MIDQKIFLPEELKAWRAEQRRLGQRLVVTNGCFDISHPGHVRYLEEARAHGDLLLIGVNSDASVRALKGPTRPINNEQDRLIVLAALESVSAVSLFGEVSAAGFLQFVEPDVYVKGGDYTLDTLNQEERRLLEELGASIVILPLVQGKSTTSIIRRAGILPAA